MERPGLRPKTRQLYDGLLRLHVLPALGRFTLVELSPARVRSWRSSLLNRGVGEVTTAKAYRLLRTILATAVEDRIIRTNPCQIKGAAVERSPERPTLTVAEVYALADAMPERFRMLVLLATFCSLRWGELAALTTDAVDLERGRIHVRATLIEMSDGQQLVGPPKTTGGRRVVAVPPGLVEDQGPGLRRA
jgi:integrase